MWCEATCRYFQHFVVHYKVLTPQRNNIILHCTPRWPKVIQTTNTYIHTFITHIYTYAYIHIHTYIYIAHIDKLLAKDPKMTEEKRLELKTVRNAADVYKKDELAAVLKKYNVKSPEKSV